MRPFLLSAVTSTWATEWTPSPTHSWYVEDQFYHGLATGDFDGDGMRELVWLDLAGGVYLRRQEDQTPVALSLGPYLARSVASGDVSGDGYDDLVLHVSDDSGQWIGVALGSASGLLPIEVAVPVEPGFLVTAIGDFNGDDLADFAFGQTVLAGSTEAPHLATARVLPAWEGPGRVWGAGDLNADGFDEILVPEWTTAQGAYVTYVGNLAAYAGAPDHQGAKLWSLEAPEGLALGHAAVVADFNGDAELDLVLTAVAFSGCVLTGDVLVYEHLGSDSPRMIGRRRVSGPDPCPGLQLLALGDDDADGRAAVGWLVGGTLEELTLSGTELTTSRSWSGTPAPGGFYALAEDLDFDGQTDVAATWVSSFDGTGLSGGASVWLSGAGDPSDTAQPGPESQDTSFPPAEEVMVGSTSGGCGCTVATFEPRLPLATLSLVCAARTRRRKHT